MNIKETKNISIAVIVCINILILLSITILIIQYAANKTIKQMYDWSEEINFNEIIESAKGTTYYISVNGTSLDGTNKDEPMSLKQAKTKTYYANDKILFKKGETFYETINFNIIANEESYIYIGSYGEGAKPKISGGTILTNLEAWEKEDEEIYRLDLSISDNFEGVTDDSINQYNIGFIMDEKGEIYGNRKDSKEKLICEYDFYCEDNMLYLKIKNNPSDILGRIMYAARKNLVKLSSNTILEGFIIECTGAHGIVKRDSTISNLYIKDCIIQNIGGSVQVESTFTRYGNGIELWNQAENTVVENCIIRNIYDAAYTLQGNTSTVGYKNNVFKNNILINCTYDIELFTYDKNNSNLQSTLKNCLNKNNISINQGNGWGYNVRKDKNIASILVCWGSDTMPEKARIIFKDNIYFNFRNSIYIHNSITARKCKKILRTQNNKLYMSENTTLISMNRGLQ